MLSGDQDGFLWTVTDDDARKRWNFELYGIPGALTIADVVRVEYAENGTDVAGVERLMKMGTRDGVTPSIHRNQLFEPGEYLIGIAHMGGPQAGGGGAYRPPAANLSFGQQGTPETSDGTASSEPAGPPELGAYRFVIKEGDRLIVSENPGPRETLKAAHAIRPGNEFATFEPRATAWYKFEFDERAAQQRWDIEARAPLGRELQARLVDAAGKELATGRADPHGRIRFPDLAPGTTTWYLELTAPEPGFIHVVTTTAVGRRVEGEEAEPNDERSQANQVDFAQPVTGRIGDDDREDWFRFTLDDAAADQLLTLRVESQAATKLQMCLYTDVWTRAQCKDGTTPLELPDLLLAAGDWGVSLSRATKAEYTLSLSPQGPVEPGIETEPNDTVEFASGVPSNFRIKGRFSGDETDFFRFAVAEEPQLWRFQVIGDNIHEVGYYDGSGEQKAVLRAQPGQKRVRLDDLFLLPGTHYLRVTGRDGGKYALLARALGPPDPNGEIEPNDQSNMQRLAIGQTRRGLMAEEKDTDYYRFFLANTDHIRLTVNPPPDGIVDADLYWYDQLLGDGQPGEPGEPLAIEGLFPPGDYYMKLSPRQVSGAEYTLALERLPRFTCPADCEPNGMNQIYLAAPLPPDLVLQGKSGDWRDWDYYQLPAFDTPTELVIRTPQPVAELTLGFRYSERERLDYDAEFGGYRMTVPAGRPYRLMLDSRGEPYRLQLEFPQGPLQPVTEPLPAELALALDVEQVSAFRLDGQRVGGMLRVTNTGDDPIEAELAAATSDYRWHADLQQPRISARAGSTTEVPVTIHVPADAWADRPVRISVRARDASGRQAETWTELGVDRDAAPVHAEQYSAIPATLRGGFNAAWNPFGAEWSADTPKGGYMDVVRDGLVFPGIHAEWGGDNDGWTEADAPKWTLQLPGDAALPVAGVAINHFGTTGAYFDIRKATLLLSEDGSHFVEALRFETLPVKTEQYFALERPMPARFARLRIDSTFQEQSSQRVFAAEWKVILEPGFDLSAGTGFNLAEPELGGHVVWDAPPEFYSPTGILVDENKSESAGMDRGPTKDYVIGFYQDRAAQITRIEWRYPKDLEERWKQFDRAEVSASLESPVGPWLPLGVIDLAGGKIVGTLELPQPAWARFVRFTAYKNPDAVGSHEPGLIRIFERPGGADYRSVLTEWGDIGPRAFYENQAGVQTEPQFVASGNDSRDTAAPLDVGTLVSGRVSLGKVENWYRLAIPAADNTLTVDLTGDPTVRTVLRMEDAAGDPMVLRRVDKAESPSRNRFEAVVEPGSEVWFDVSEPPRNVVFAWDTSASVNAYIPLINNSLVAFSGQVVPGREAVNLMPFSMTPLLARWYGEPYVLQTILNDYRRESSSSSAEWTLKTAAQELAPLPGTKAIVVITDAETPPDGGMWGPMREVQPRIFGIGVAGAHMIEQHKFRDWTLVNGGNYTQLRYEGEMEVAFDRASTLMHRPAGYTLEVGSEFREAPGPGRLRVLSPEQGGAGGAAVELILDASGSMLQRIEGKRRIVMAKEVLTEAVRQHIPAGTPMALRVFGDKEPDACRSDLEIPLAPLDPDAAAATIAGINAMNLARTPIADSLAAVRGDLGGASEAVIVLVTDGEETCDGDPAKVIDALQAAGFHINLNIVGFAIDDAELAARFESWAARASGRYFAANDQGGLSDALEVALRVPFTVYDQGGNKVAEGEVGGDPVELEQGIYRVQVRTATPRTFENVAVEGESEVTLKLD
ncbi:MAG: hypothetical protein WB812_14810 [Woeseiaceae bacterium]